MIEINTLMQQLSKLNNKKEIIEEELADIENLKSKIDANKKEIDSEIASLKTVLLEKMKNSNLVEYQNDDLVSFVSQRKSTGYSEEEEKKILNILKAKNLTNCFKIKESLAKRALNSELMTNTELQEELKDYGKEKITEYVVVTTAEKYKKMKEHINESNND